MKGVKGMYEELTGNVTLGIIVGGIIGFSISIISCIANDLTFDATVGNILFFTGMGIIIGIIFAFYLARENIFSYPNVDLGDYLDGARIGGFLGVVIGITRCSYLLFRARFLIMSGTTTFDEFFGFFIFGVIGAVLGLVVTGFLKSEAERRDKELRQWQAEEERLAQQRAVEGRKSAEINNIFNANPNLNAIQKLLTEPSISSDNKIFTRQKIAEHKTTIYNATISELLKRNFQNAKIGFTIIVELDDNPQYGTALALLQNPSQLQAVMQKQGLPIESQYYKEISQVLK